ncbi:hypothetical protein F5148DRAFT_1149690 [Russula earlei]|uniref:Uncharacterized protein n=1 Tax=Russula earlei TaxID=71964 RepID=A0ACC0U754_9AGAM|nr:hypothetical protein F5148DRAFT_1149690 [Russula earlei]
MVELEGVGGASGSERGASGHGSVLLAKPRMHVGEGHVPKLHVRISPDTQLAVLRVDHDEQVALVGDPDDDVASQEWGFQSMIRTIILVMDQGERHGLESADDIHMGLVREKTVGRVLLPVSSASCTAVGSKMRCMIMLCGCSGHTLHMIKGRENVCSTLFHPDVGSHVVWTPKHGVDAESMGVSYATGACGKEKVFGDNWECSSSCESREGKLGTGVDLHQTRGSYGCGQITKTNLTWAVAAGAAGAEMVAGTVNETEAAEMAEAKREVAVVEDGAVVTAGRTGMMGATASVDKTGDNDGKGKAAARQVTAVVMMGNAEAMVMVGGTGMSEAMMGKGEVYGSNGR